MTAELAVEQAAGTLAAERLSAETAERLRIERDFQTVKLSNTTLQQVMANCKRGTCWVHSRVVDECC